MPADLHQVRMAPLAEGNQVGAEQYPGDPRGERADHRREMDVHLRRPAREIDDLEMAPAGVGDDLLHGAGLHGFPASRPGLVMAMAARLIAEEAQVDLQGDGLAAGQGQALSGQAGGKGLDGR